MKNLNVMMMTLMMCLMTMVSFGQHLKKDGTPDRRYKENKISTYTPSTTTNYNVPTNTDSPKIIKNDSTTTTTTHLKKDGTPDRRYKENRSTETDNNGSVIHLKKDGTPDRRYKENKSKK